MLYRVEKKVFYIMVEFEITKGFSTEVEIEWIYTYLGLPPYSISVPFMLENQSCEGSLPIYYVGELYHESMDDFGEDMPQIRDLNLFSWLILLN